MVIFIALQSSPNLQRIHQIDANFAAENQRIAQRLIKSLKSDQQPIRLQATQAELHGLSAFGHRAIPQLTSDVILFQDSALISFSLALPFPKIIRYLNVELMLVSSKEGIDLGTVYVGGLPLPGNGLVKLAEWLTNSYVKKDFGTALLSMIKSVDITSNRISMEIVLSEKLKDKPLSHKDSLFALRDKLALYGDVEVIRFYHQSLVDTIEQSGTMKLSLAEYIGFTFGLVKQRNLARITNSPAKENRAALMALVVYFGTDKFELLVGDISKLSTKQLQQRTKRRSRVMLRERVDIQKHFIYSVALQLFGTSTASNAIGELKEFLDSNSGGSGFSFADLMADRAGTRLAMLATDSDESALKVQEHLADIIEEDLLLPELTGLPEGISQQKFEQYYYDINSLVYQTMLSNIDERLRKIAVYRD
ncbi:MULTISPECIES: hypothetical protein [unclassified Colwellia]|uniref:hypothetical protein n=1 Tax=unclassified Colwellia TaxID=196834 RepID=UPI0015F42764|nr:MULTISPECIES: hypothetical protein [unclassified Colwellia]MBA6234198.1 hypothetical protein [Colwellia sp. MB02u-7]MBA6237801.1 hypothetical protein [Colwellia sp. MB02u-11]MBA6254846.1 hypothetical protein [Colwellia sp. MB3u-28]MBA6259836.1 hypothetical protein [Colwellia sp. MB3u-41]MBA6300948.1 hypothetical protein [Colwellia sp. MB3u-22]